MKFTAALALLLLPATATAKSQIELGWPLPEVFGAAVRFVRVDRGCKLGDRDESAAYLVFECPTDEGKPPHHGSLELYRLKTLGGDKVRVQVTLTDDPRYLELRFLELLERKLKEERGAPPPRERPAPPPSAVDAGS